MSQKTTGIIWPWEPRWWGILLATLVASSAVGYFMHRAHKDVRRHLRLLWLALGLLTSSAVVLAVALFMQTTGL
jgi:hypothetical protein